MVGGGHEEPVLPDKSRYSAGIICLLETANSSRQLRLYHSFYILHQLAPDIVYSSVNTLPVETSCNWFILIQRHVTTDTKTYIVSEENSDCTLNIR